MAKIEFTVGRSSNMPTEAELRRRSVDTILGGGGPSERGSSFYKSLMICPREHALSYVHKIKPNVTGDALSSGSIFHKALEVFYTVIMVHQRALDALNAPQDDHYYWGCAFEAQEAAWASIATFATEPGYEKIYETVQRILEAYFEKYWGHDKWRVLAVEETLHFKEPGFDYSARIDLIVEWNERTWIVEHKTAKAVSMDTLDHYDMDIQTLGQQWLYENCVDTSQFPPLAGVLVNITTKHKTVQFFRKEVCPSPAHLRMFEEAIGYWIVLRTAARRTNWPRALGHCAGFARGYSKCQFYSVCRNWPGMSAAQLAADPPEGFHREVARSAE